ncbi:DnaJ (Hsp40), sub C, member 2 [Desmophyllum pertusum]|uniref:DnaJ (Hsp40), sub C, member 2 n=1 Tax=Desmophyllum pertusum TaxID=174260 RepID=A0A9W9Z7Z6_9CNID|nr:DnaJ (Hsp40), sub C, member 2 [Desmophyllum pertusum]
MDIIMDKVRDQGCGKKDWSSVEQCYDKDCRDERRWIEKQNRVMRQKRKKEEVTRIRNLVATEKGKQKEEKLPGRWQKEKETRSYRQQGGVNNNGLPNLSPREGSLKKEAGFKKTEKFNKNIYEQGRWMEQMRERMRQEAIAETKQTTKSKDDDEVTSDDWTEDQTQLLVKAVNLFPAGTASRYMSTNPTMKHEVNRNAFAKFDKDHAQSKATSSAESDPTRASLQRHQYGLQKNNGTSVEMIKAKKAAQSKGKAT